MLHRHRLIVTLVAAFSCSVQADVIFVDAANCPLSDCCFTHGTPGCDDRGCESIVCVVDPTCCDVAWSPACVGLVFLICDICPPSGGNGSEVDPYCSIQTAIDNAVDTDEIVVAAGTYFETIDYLGKAITLHSSDGPEVTIIDAQQSGSVVTSSLASPDTVLEGFTITGGNGVEGAGMYNLASSPTVTNCTFVDNSASQRGGGMYNFISLPTVTNCTFVDNSAFEGGAIYNEGSDPTVTGCVFNGNSVSQTGGGIYNYNSSPTVINCTFIGNSAYANGGGMLNNLSSPTVTDCTFTGNSAGPRGGGMCNLFSSSPTVTNCTFSGNSTHSQGDGAGMYNLSSSPTVTNCTFSGNTAETGGGMENHSSSNPTVTDCTFSGNTAESGGGMLNSLSSPTVTNCIFSGNSASSAFGGGGGMSNHGGSPTVTNCMFSGNTANKGGGGMRNTDFGGGTSATVTNCTFSGNTANIFGGGMYNTDSTTATVTNCTFSGNTANNVGGGLWNSPRSSSTVTNCILWNNDPDAIFGPATVAYSDVESGAPGNGNIDADPLFVDPDSGDLRLSPGSPCIDAGNNFAVPAGITTDLDRNPRFVDDPDTLDCQQAPGQCGDPPVVDMGAYELQIGSACPWDCGGDNDGDVGIPDFLATLAQWGGPGSCDFDGGGVGINDLLALLAHWGPCP